MLCLSRLTHPPAPRPPTLPPLPTAAGQFQRLPSRRVTGPELLTCHKERLVEYVEAAAERARQLPSSSTGVPPVIHREKESLYFNEHTADCARLSAGGSVDVACAVASGRARAGLAVVRPPGHHAESNTALGFCFFNNAAVAARAAQAAGAARVLILDWDIHHGNGTAEILEDDPTIMYMSIHRYE